jgi:hypothetical protein
VVEFASNTAEALAADDAPTINFPLLVIAPVDKLAIVPTLVKLEPVTVEFNVVPVKVPASADDVIVISPLPSNATPFIFLAVANLVAVPALPETVV